MRPYHPNSPQAVARIVVLALVSDGKLDEGEIAMLRKIRAFERIGLPEERFHDVLQDFCHDLLTGSACDDVECRLDGERLAALLDDIDDPYLQKEALRLMLDVIRADGRLEHGESLLFWQALERWHLQISDIVLEHRPKPRRARTVDRSSPARRKPLVPRSPYGRWPARA